MSETVYSIERDLKEAQAMADALIPYVYQDQLYGKVGGGGLFSSSNMPSLTIGALLMRLRRLRAQEHLLTEEQRALLTKLEAQNEAVRSEWNMHYSGKMVQEANSRLKAMSSFFAECEEDPRLCASVYLPEALRRTIVQELADALERYNLPVEDLHRSMRQVDGKLRRYAEPNEFLWAKELEAVYPRETYWWLYAKPPQPGARKD
jgi:hypothetical protein